MNRRTPQRCAERGCPYLGWWDETQRCPEHAAEFRMNQPLDPKETR